MWSWSLLLCFGFAAEFKPVTEGPAVTVDFIYQDFARFFRDVGNSNAILRLTRAPAATTLALYLARGKGPPGTADVATRVDGRPAVARVAPSKLLATIELEKTSDDSSTYRVVKVETDRSNLVFEVGGTVKFDGQTPGFDLGSKNVIEVRATPDADRRVELIYIEAQVPTADSCANPLGRP